MVDTVLVGYATRHGSTGEVAGAVAETLRERGVTVDLQPLRAVRSLDGYSAAVLGAPLYIGRLIAEARSFLSRQQDAIAGMPVALFVMGPTTPDEADRQTAQGQLDALLARSPGLAPAAVQLFAGKLDPEALRFPDRLLTRFPASPLYEKPAMDARDWDAIRAWAADLVDLLQGE